MSADEQDPQEPEERPQRHADLPPAGPSDAAAEGPAHADAPAIPRPGDPPPRRKKRRSIRESLPALGQTVESLWPPPPSSDPATRRRQKRDAWRDARRAAGPTLVVHLVGLGLALWPTLALGAMAAAAGPAEVEQDVLLDLLRFGREAGLVGAVAAGSLATLLAAVLAVPLQLGWIAALGGQRPGAAVVQALRRTPMALLVSLVVVVLTGIGVALGGVPVYLLHRGFSEDPDARLHDLLVLGAMAIPVFGAFTGVMWHDLCRAACLDHGLRESLRRGWAALRSAGGTFGWVTLGRLCLGLPLLLLPLSPWVALVTLQLAALASTFLRSRWLAEARIQVRSIHPTGGSPSNR